MSRMICEVHYTWPDLPSTHQAFIKKKLIEEVVSRGEASLKTTRGARLAFRNLAKTIRDETRDGKEFIDYVIPPNGRGEHEAILYTKMWVEKIQAFWCEDTIDEEDRKWDAALVDIDIPRGHHRVLAVIYALPDEGTFVFDAYLAIRILLRVEF